MNDYEHDLIKNPVQQPDNDLGIISFALGFVSLFFLAPLFVPIALTLGIIAVCKKQFAWGLAGIICSLIGFITSPILLAMLGLAVLSTTDINLPSINQPSSSVSSPNTSTPLPDFLQKLTPILENIGATIESEIKSLDTSSSSQNSTTQRPATDTKLPLPAGFLKAYPEYSAQAEKKAIALAHDRDGRYAWGYGYNYSTQEQANARAFSECKSRMVEYNVENDCKLYAIGNQVVW